MFAHPSGTRGGRKTSGSRSLSSRNEDWMVGKHQLLENSLGSDRIYGQTSFNGPDIRHPLGVAEMPRIQFTHTSLVHQF